ncbi:MAG: glyoxylase-like metal-dependent hydrolase (beta-lactamase superfamily II), partial [Pseudohongiellaceae bacterium]
MTTVGEMMQHPEVTPFYDEETGTFSYVVKDPSSADCAIIDSVLNFNY